MRRIRKLFEKEDYDYHPFLDRTVRLDQARKRAVEVCDGEDTMMIMTMMKGTMWMMYLME